MVGVTRQLYVFLMIEGSLPPGDTCMNLKSFLLSKDDVQFKKYAQSLSFACLFSAFFFNSPCQFTPLFNLCSLIFGLLTSGWLHSIALTPYF
jgi:hypothetical protein